MMMSCDSIVVFDPPFQCASHYVFDVTRPIPSIRRLTGISTPTKSLEKGDIQYIGCTAVRTRSAWYYGITDFGVRFVKSPGIS
jgi:hypothetical protein